MEPIRVPRPPKEAFNKHRPMSDLIRKQVEHFKHLEHKLPEHVRKMLPQHHIATEDDAARYIGPMTALLRSQAAPPGRPEPVAKPKRELRAAAGVSIAAAAEKPKREASTKSKAAKKSTTPRKGKKR